MHAPHRGHLDVPPVVRIEPERDLTLADVVAVARGRGAVDAGPRARPAGVGFARVELAGDWEARCQRTADYVRHVMDVVHRHDVEGLARLVRERFAGHEALAGEQRIRDRYAPASIAGLLAAGEDDVEATRKLAERALIYGVTTGFGVNKDKPIRNRDDVVAMQVNILRSHATGVGDPFPVEVVRAAMLIRVRAFVEGWSGVRPELVRFIVELLNRGVHPWVPQQGSVGSSGDLCPLSHLFLVVIGEGHAWGAGGDRRAAPSRPGESLPPPTDFPAEPPRPAAEVLREAGIEPLASLEPKEGLALTNGTSVTTAAAALACYDASTLLGTANLAAAMSLQALRGCTRAFDPKLHAVRRHEGQSRAARAIFGLARGGSLLDQSADVQDAYSLRCAPQVHGAAWTAIEHAWDIIEREVNAVTDNPLLFPDAAGFDADQREPYDAYAKCIWDAYSGGNFHGEPVGLVCDYLKIAVAELANISERRIQHMLDRHHNRGLPANLWPEDASGTTPAGLNSGLMLTQYAAAALVSENKVLCHPSSVDSIPTSSNAEDHVAMSTTAARHARQVCANARSVLAFELIAAAQALEILQRRSADGESTGAPDQAGGGAGVVLSSAAAAAVEHLRSDRPGPPVPFLESRDMLMWPLVAAAAGRIADGSLLRAVQRST